MNGLMRRTICLTAMSIALAGLAPFSAAQQAGPGVPIPADAKQATLEVSDTGEITLNGKPARLSAAAQIRGTTNLIVLSQSLRGKYPIRVMLDQNGFIHRAWIIDGNR